MRLQQKKGGGENRSPSATAPTLRLQRGGDMGSRSKEGKEHRFGRIGCNKYYPNIGGKKESRSRPCLERKKKTLGSPPTIERPDGLPRPY